MSNEMAERIQNGSTMDYSNMVTLQLPGLIKLFRQTYILKNQPH